MKHKWFLITAGALAFAGCSAGADNAEFDDDPTQEVSSDTAALHQGDRADIPFRVITDFSVSSTVGGAETRRTFTTAQSFRAFFGEALPGVDFSREWVSFYSAGVRRTGGYRASFSRIRLDASGSMLKLTTRLDSPGAGCAVTQALTRPMVLVVIPIPRPRPIFARYLTEVTTRSCDPAPTCANVRCAAGTHCELQSVTCIRAPCPPHPTCVPDADPCAAVRCAVGTHCVASGGAARCERTPGACRADADCNLYDNYCGGCACNPLGYNQRPVTCERPVMCVRQPCGGLVARCDTSTGRCQAAPAPTAGPSCGRNTCAVGQVCCNASCGICTPPDGACIQLACVDR